MENRKPVLVHEYLTRLGGAERVLARIAHLFPEAPIYTLLYSEQKTGSVFPRSRVKTSFLQRFPRFLQKRVKFLAPLCPSAVEAFDLSKHRLVISSSNSFAKGVIIKPQTMHVCYCHAPSTFVWDVFHSYRKDQRKGGIMNFGINLVAHYLRQWDRQAADRVDYFIANSQTTQKRIQKFYRRDSEVIYPPVDVARITPTRENDGFFLIVSQLTPYKRIDIAVEAFNKLGLPLVVVGDGPERKRLEKMAASNVTFTGFLTDEEVVDYYQRCRGFVFAGSDDFGIAPVEAMAAGKPVLAYRDGGATETVIEGVTGEFFDAPIVELLADGVRRMLENESGYDPETIRAQAEKFSAEEFDRQIQEYIERAYTEYSAQYE